MKRYDLDGVLDKCAECGGFVCWVFSEHRWLLDKYAHCVQCADCANSIEWVEDKCESMIIWNRAQRKVTDEGSSNKR